jgi:hypothetical protein
VVPRIRRVVHDGSGCVVKLIILNVEIGELLPVLLLITYANELGDVYTGVEDLDVLHKLLQAVPGVQDTKFGEKSLFRFPWLWASLVPHKASPCPSFFPGQNKIKWRKYFLSIVVTLVVYVKEENQKKIRLLT